MENLNKISPKALADWLTELETEGLVKRAMFRETPPRVECSLTPDGLELLKLITPLMKWPVQGEYRKTKHQNKPNQLQFQMKATN